MSRQRCVGIDARFACARYDGVGRYVGALAGVLLRAPARHRYVALRPGRGEALRHPLPLPASDHLVLDPGHAGRPESLWSQWELPGLVRGAGCDLWHAPFPLVPLGLGTPMVVTHHDCIPERMPAYFGRSRRWIYRTGVRSALRRARLVIVPSASVAADCARFYRLPGARVRVVPMAVTLPPPPSLPDRSYRRRLGIGDADYLLVVGRPRPHKGYRTLVRALGALPAGQRPLLVSVGTPDPHLRDGHEAEAGRLGVALLRASGVTDDDLLALYRGATLVAVPSLVEGFGLPLLEALAAGAPVLASDIQPLRASGAGSCRFVAAGDAGAWAEALRACLADDSWRRRAATAGPRRAAALGGWERVAAATQAVYDEALG
ncbi:MAG TPA: glycosyltransferase family 1 protein [Candidatus Micrarchaeia archaeon]|nr:glycosyltransferase family 1 protein [Candidatus Micrarchaeia archaeon]